MPVALAIARLFVVLGRRIFVFLGSKIMKRFARTLIVFGLLVSAPATAAVADGWSWNPLRNLPTVGSPAWLKKPFTATSSAVKRSTTGTWQAIASGTNSAWKKTTDLLDPYPDDVPQPAKLPSGSGAGWFDSDKEKKKPMTVNEFFAQERVE